jgi:hypothetical protein
MIVPAFGTCLQRTGIGTARRFGDGEADLPPAREHGSCDRVQQFGGAHLHDRRQADPVRGQVGEHDAGAGAMEFLGEDDPVVRVGILVGSAD